MTDELSPTGSFKQNFDLISPECDEEQKSLFGVPLPPFLSEKVVNWVEETFPSSTAGHSGHNHHHHPPVIDTFRGLDVVKKVLYATLYFSCNFILMAIKSHG
jgi:myotubularin-related protein 6/7/8